MTASSRKDDKEKKTEVNLLDKLPDEIILRILLNLGPKELNNCRELARSSSTTRNANDNDVWRTLALNDFRELGRNANTTNGDYRKTYKHLYNSNYGKIRFEFLRLFGLVKRGDLDEIKRCYPKLGFSHLSLSGSDSINLFKLAKQYRHQHLLNFFYELIEAEVINSEHPESMHTNEKVLVLAVAIATLQPLTTFKKLLERLAYYNRFNNLDFGVVFAFLNIAAAYGHLELVEYIYTLTKRLDFQGPFVVPLSEEGTVLAVACRNGHEAIVAFLLKNNALACETADTKCCPLIEAINAGHETIAVTLIENGITLNGKNRHIRGFIEASPLQLAAHCGLTNVARLLIDKGVDPNNHGPYKSQTALWHAVYAGHTDIVKLLIGRGANVNQRNPKDKYQTTPLLEAVISSNTEITSLLLAAGAKPNLRFNRNGPNKTVLMLATNLTIVKQLLKAKANLHDVDGEGHTVLTNAVANHTEKNPTIEVIRYFLRKKISPKADNGACLRKAVMRSDPALIQFFLEQDPDIWQNYQDAFDVAMQYGGDKHIRLMVLHAFDKNFNLNTWENYLLKSPDYYKFFENIPFLKFSDYTQLTEQFKHDMTFEYIKRVYAAKAKQCGTTISTVIIGTCDILSHAIRLQQPKEITDPYFTEAELLSNRQIASTNGNSRRTSMLQRAIQNKHGIVVSAIFHYLLIETLKVSDGWIRVLTANSGNNTCINAFIEIANKDERIISLVEDILITAIKYNAAPKSNKHKFLSSPFNSPLGPEKMMGALKMLFQVALGMTTFDTLAAVSGKIKRSDQLNQLFNESRLIFSPNTSALNASLVLKK